MLNEKMVFWFNFVVLLFTGYSTLGVALNLPYSIMSLTGLLSAAWNLLIFVFCIRGIREQYTQRGYCFYLVRKVKNKLGLK